MKRRELISFPLCHLIASRSFGAAEPEVVRTRVQSELGSFVITVAPKTAPITVANYLAYVDGRHLDNASVYRVVTLANQSADTKYKIEVVQWGMNLPDDKPAPFRPIVHETTQQTGLKHLDGVVSMARGGPGTASSEFFICIGAQPELDFGGRRNPDGQGFAAFGRVTEGMDVVRAIHKRGEAKQYLAKPLSIASVRRMT